MKNNFQSIKSLLNFDSPDDFYFIQIIKRRKDNPDLGRDMKLIDNFFIYSIEEFEKSESKIISQCVINNARAYIRPNRRNSKTVAIQTIRKISEMLIDGNYRATKSAYLSACGDYNSEKNKKWIVDIDKEDLDKTEDIRKTIIELHSTIPNSNYSIIAEIETNSGLHILTHPFNMMEFRKKYPNVDIHKDNMLLLYIP